MSSVEFDLRENGRFDVLRRLGEGGMGVVYEAYDRERRMRVALKTLRTLSAEGILRFKNEFRALQDLSHPNLCTLGELITLGRQWFFTMELVDGVDLLGWVRPERAGVPSPVTTSRDFVDPTPSADTLQPHASAVSRIERAGRPPLDVVRLRAGLVELARGVSALHAAGVVHRDIKPSNILVEQKTGRVVLLDFGLAQSSTRAGESDVRVVGTADYMAPEQASGRKVGPEADWYSVGVVLYEALTGSVPFSGAPLEVLLQKQGRDPAPPRALAPETPADLDALCVGLLRKDARERFGAKALYERLLRGNEAAELASAAHREARFVGRRAELAALEAAWERTRAGAPVTVHVRGESGVGKSALVRHFVDGLRKSSADVVLLQGRCYERESVPYKALDGVVDSLARWLARLPKVDAAMMLPARAGLLAEVFPVLRRVEAVASAPRPPADGDPQQLRRQLFTALRELLARVASKRALVVVIDDLQWADLDSLALLEAITRPPGAPTMLLLATARQGEDAPASRPPSLLAAEAREVHLARLPPDEARALASELLSSTGGASELSAEVIAEEAGGHPLFIDELVRHALAARADRGAPLHLEDALWDRVRRLEGEAQRVLELVAVAGGPIVQQAAARAADVDFATFAGHAATLRAANLVRTTGQRPADLIEPYHDRVRATIESHRTATEVRRAHERIAIGLESIGRADPEALATHWQGAGENDKAAAYATQAAERAYKALAFDRAAQLYRQTLVMRPPGAADVATLQVRLGDALAQTGRGAESARAYLSAAERTSLIGPADALELRRKAAEQLLRAGHVDDGLQAMAPVLAAVKLAVPESPRAALMSLLWQRAQLKLRGLKFKRRQASELQPALLARVDAAWSIAIGLGNVDTIRGADFATRHLRLALKAGEPSRVARAMAFEACLTAAMGAEGVARANTLATEAEKIADEVKDSHATGLAVAARAIALHMNGHWSDCLPFFDEAERIFRERCTGVAWELATGNLLRSYSLARLGELTELSKNVTAFLQEAEQRGDLYGSTVLRMGEPNLIWLAMDLPDEARSECEEGIRRWSQRGFHQQHADFNYAMTQIDLYVGDGAAAFARISGVWPQLEKSMTLRLDVARIINLDLRGRAAVAAAAVAGEAHRKTLVAEAERMAQALEKERAAWAKPGAASLRAALARLGGDDAAAAALLAAAASGFDEHEMRMHAAVARGRRGALVGGEEGRADRERAAAWMSAQAVANPDKFMRVLAPGF
ncbi:MAG TPA: AAA family ATPase [Polyangia bacterium]|nr:AAA family ATPase [Polyangia bacterium]